MTPYEVALILTTAYAVGLAVGLLSSFARGGKP